MAQRLRYAELAPDGIAAMRQLEHYLNSSTALPAVLLELVRLRASQVNGCDFCRHAHTGELRKHHEPDSRIDAVAQWRASDAFTPKERAALAWAETVTNVSVTQVPEADFVAVSEFFTGKNLADLTLAISSINAWNRLGVAFQAEWNPRPHTPAANDTPNEVSAVGDDGGKITEA